MRSDASGTSFGFSRYLTKVSPDFKAKVNFSQTPPWTAPNLQKGPGNPGVANCITSNQNSIGYVDLADATNAGLSKQLAAIGKSQTVKGKRKTVFLLPNLKSISAAGDIKSFPASLLVDPSASPVPGAYPIVITTWIVTYGDYAAAGKDLAGRQAAPQLRVRRARRRASWPASATRRCRPRWSPAPRSRSPPSSSTAALSRQS